MAPNIRSVTTTPKPFWRSDRRQTAQGRRKVVHARRPSRLSHMAPQYRGDDTDQRDTHRPSPLNEPGDKSSPTDKSPKVILQALRRMAKSLDLSKYRDGQIRRLLERRLNLKIGALDRAQEKIRRMAELVIEEIFISEASDLEYGEHRGHPMDISVDGFVDQDSDSDRMSIRSEDFDDPFEGDTQQGHGQNSGVPLLEVTSQSQKRFRVPPDTDIDVDSFRRRTKADSRVPESSGQPMQNQASVFGIPAGARRGPNKRSGDALQSSSRKRSRVSDNKTQRTPRDSATTVSAVTRDDAADGAEQRATRLSQQPNAGVSTQVSAEPDNSVVSEGSSIGSDEASIAASQSGATQRQDETKGSASEEKSPFARSTW